jgi:hypothetical protein
MVLTVGRRRFYLKGGDGFSCKRRWFYLVGGDVLSAGRFYLKEQDGFSASLIC